MELPLKDSCEDGGRYVTANINLAAALCAAVDGTYMDRENLNIDDPRHVEIPVISPSQSKLNEALRKWDTRQLMVNARVMADYLKDAKSMIIKATGGRHPVREA